MAVVLLAASGAFYALVPQKALDSARQESDSINAAALKKPPPAWLERLAPGYRQAATTKPSPAMERVGTIFGLAVVVVLFALLLGTLSWGAGMLLGLSLTGRLPGIQGESLENLVADLPKAIGTA